MATVPIVAPIRLGGIVLTSRETIPYPESSGNIWYSPTQNSLMIDNYPVVPGATGATGPAGQGSSAGGGGLILYMNYNQDTTPTLPKLTSSELQGIITGRTFQNAHTITYNSSGSQNTDVSLLSVSPDLSLSQMEIRVKTQASSTDETPIVQFAISKADIPNNNNIIPPGIWTMSLYAKAKTNNDENKIGVRFYLLGKNISGGNYTNIVTNGSDVDYLSTTSQQKKALDLIIQDIINTSMYDSFMVVVTAKNVTAHSYEAYIYFQSTNTYSHIHTTYPSGGGCTGPVGPTLPIVGGGTGAILLNNPVGSTGVYYSEVLQVTSYSGGTGTVQIAGNLIPATNNTYSLGTTGCRWKDLYVGGETIDINGVAITANSSGTVLVNNVELAKYVYTPPAINISNTTFTARDSTAKAWKSVKTSADGSHVIAIANGSNSIYRSTNYGGSYTTVAGTTAEWACVAISETGQYQIAATMNGFPYISEDYGATFSIRNTSPINISKNYSGAAISADGRIKYLCVDGGEHIYKSTDISGNTWTAKSASRYYKDIVTDASGQRLLTYTGISGADPNTLFYSNNGLETSLSQASGTSAGNWRGISISYSGENMMATIDSPGQIWHSSTFGSSWSRVINDGKGYVGCAISESPRILYATVPDAINSGIYYSVDASGTTWQKFADSSDGAWISISTGKTSSHVNACISDNAQNGIYSIIIPQAGEGANVYTKTFVVDHPIDPARYLVHACLEGPEAGVYYRGIGQISEGEGAVFVNLPHYAQAFAREFTIQITPICSSTRPVPNVYGASEVENGGFTVYGSAGRFYWHAYGMRSAIDVEPPRNAVVIRGEGPYRWVE
jgi:hypothetical protein